jgi:Mn2+/Fe2+ NRAMP family transporter
MSLGSKSKNDTGNSNAENSEIRGALGRLDPHEDTAKRSLFKKLLAFAAIAGPGIIVMVGDNDAGGVATYAQAGQNYGTSLMWVILILIPVLMIAQEMAARLGTVTGAGHARLIRERFGKAWAAFSVFDLFILNFLTLMTEFIGVSLGFSYLGISSYLTVPVSALILIIFALTGSFVRWERFLYVLIAISLIEFPLAISTHPLLKPTLKGLFIPSVQGGWNSAAIMMVIGLIGTTVAPWQLYFQQSNVIDKRITPRWLKYERADTFFGAVLTNVAAVAIMATCAFAFYHTKFFGGFVSALGVSRDLSQAVSHPIGIMFAILLIDSALIGAATVSLSSSYAYGDAFGIRHSLHKNFFEAKKFYISYIIQVLFAAGLVLIPKLPLGLITFSVQVLAGILLPSAIVFLLILCNDKALLGPWANALWLNIVAGMIVFVLVMLSLVITISTILPNISAVEILTVVTIAGLLFVAIGVIYYGFKYKDALKRTSKLPRTNSRRLRLSERLEWSTPSLALLTRPKRDLFAQVSLVFLRAYLIVAVLGLIIKTIQLAVGQ